MDFKDREQLYKFLIDDFRFRNIEERYDAKVMGSFYVILAGKDILLRYVNDRSILRIDVATDTAEPEWFYLELVEALIYKEQTVKAMSITELNDFLKKEFNKIAELFNESNFLTTTKLLKEIIDRDSKLRFP